MNDKFLDLLATLSPEERGGVMQRLADMIEAKHPGTLDAFAEDYRAAGQFRDYLSETEARLVTDSFANFDGSAGAKWTDPEALWRKARETGAAVEVPGEYNRWAFYTVANMIYSDYGGVLRTYLDGERVARVCCLMAVALLEDKDRDDARGVRWYLGLQD